MMTVIERRSPLTIAAAVALSVACASASSISHAQPPSKPGGGSGAGSGSGANAADPMAEAKQRFNEGIVLADQGNHEAARLKFNQAFTLLKSPAVVYNLARAEQLSGHPLEALEHFRLFQRMALDTKISEAEKQRAADNIAELSKKVGQIDIEAPPGTRVSLDGRTLDTVSDPIPVAPGKHVVEATIDGKVKSLTIEAQAGTMSKAKLTDDTAPNPNGNANGSNGNAGSNNGQNDHPPLEEEKRPTIGYAIPIGLGVIGLTGLVLGIGLRVAAGSKSDEAVEASRDPVARQGCLNATSPECERVRSAAESERDLKNVSTFSLVGGVAFSAAAVLTYMFWPKSHHPDPSPRQGRTMLIPLINPPTRGAAEAGMAFRTAW